MKATNLIFAAAAVACISAPALSRAEDSALKLVSEDMRLGTTDYVPSQFAEDGLSKLTFVDFDEYTGSLHAQCVDGTLMPVSEVMAVSGEEDYNYNYEGIGKINIHWSSIQRNSVNYRNTVTDDYFEIKNVLDEYLQNLTGCKFYNSHYYGRGISSLGGEYVYTSDNDSWKEVDGMRVPWWFFYTYGDNLVEVKCTGECIIEIIKPQNKEFKNIYRTPFVSPTYTDIDNSTSSLGSMSLTQTLFDSDAAFEYISPIYGEPTTKDYVGLDQGVLYDNDTYFSFEAAMHGSREAGDIIGFRILKDNGSEVQTVRFPDGHSAQGDNFMTILAFGGKRYLQCALDGITMLYEICGGANGVSEVATFKTRVYPTVVEAGENVNIDFSDSQSGARMIRVDDMSGRTVYTSNVPAAEGSASFPASSMSKGMNIVTVSEAGAGQTTTKVILK